MRATNRSETMKHADNPKMLLKHPFSARFFHWVHLITFVVLLITGVGILTPYLNFITVPFGGLKGSAVVHQYFGILYLVAPLLYVIFRFKQFSEFMKRISNFDRDNIEWLKCIGGYLDPIVKAKNGVPPQGKFNAGQQILGWIIIIVSLVLGATGLIMMYFESFAPALVRWSNLIHAVCALFIGAGVLVHFYLAALHPKAKKELKTMLGHGYIEADYAKGHNPKWYQEMMDKRK
jgi:formate dehydrogenase subunit gamma